MAVRGADGKLRARLRSRQASSRPHLRGLEAEGWRRGGRLPVLKTSWTTNPDWHAPLTQQKICGYVSDSFIPCERTRPCPVHQFVSSREPEAFTPRAELPAP